jgi:hypothetical protein
VASPVGKHFIRYFARIAKRRRMAVQEMDVTTAGTSVGSDLIRAGATPVIGCNALLHNALPQTIVRELLQCLGRCRWKAVVVEHLLRLQWGSGGAAKQEGCN